MPLQSASCWRAAGAARARRPALRRKENGEDESCDGWCESSDSPRSRKCRLKLERAAAAGRASRRVLEAARRGPVERTAGEAARLARIAREACRSRALPVALR